MPQGTVNASFWGLISRRERWGLTWKGCLAAGTGAIAAGWMLCAWIHPFLAITQRVSTEVMVVEGWISTPALRDTAHLFLTGGYQTVYTTGGPTSTDPTSKDISDTYASVSAKRLAEFGVPRDRIHMIPAAPATLDRTFASATALRTWFQENNVQVTAFNVISQGPHARRSRLLFEKAFGNSATIGVIALPRLEYDAGRWWQSSEGLKEVISETGAYLYARLLFRAGE